MAKGSVPTILVNIEFNTYPFVQYPTLEAFLDRLDIDKPSWHWREIFFLPLQRLGVRTLDDMMIVSPEAIFVFCKLNPIAIMDLYIHVVDTIDALHHSHGISGAWRIILSEVRYLINLVALYWQRNSTTGSKYLVNENNMYHTYSLEKDFGCPLLCTNTPMMKCFIQTSGPLRHSYGRYAMSEVWHEDKQVIRVECCTLYVSLHSQSIWRGRRSNLLWSKDCIAPNLKVR